MPDLQSCSPLMAFCVTIVPPPLPSRNIISTINMFFRNKFGFRRYSILDAEVVNDEQAEFIANFGGYNIMAIATVRETDENGLIQRLTVRPK